MITGDNHFRLARNPQKKLPYKAAFFVWVIGVTTTGYQKDSRYRKK